MTSYASLLSSEGLKLRSRLKISSRPAYTGMSFGFFIFLILDKEPLQMDKPTYD